MGSPSRMLVSASRIKPKLDRRVCYSPPWSYLEVPGGKLPSLPSQAHWNPLRFRSRLGSRFRSRLRCRSRSRESKPEMVWKLVWITRLRWFPKLKASSDDALPLCLNRVTYNSRTNLILKGLSLTLFLPLIYNKTFLYSRSTMAYHSSYLTSFSKFTLWGFGLWGFVVLFTVVNFLWSCNSPLTSPLRTFPWHSPYH